MINLKNVQINWDASGTDEIMQNVMMILTTPVGTVPFDRNFGIDPDIVDLPIDRAKAKVTVEYIAKIRKYEPRAKILKVTFTQDSMNGQLIPKVVIGLAK